MVQYYQRSLQVPDLPEDQVSLLLIDYLLILVHLEDLNVETLLMMLGFLLYGDLDNLLYVVVCDLPDDCDYDDLPPLGEVLITLYLTGELESDEFDTMVY
ncbi:unnamed protein product, partial [Meganyctiphanes norvegica]